MKTAIASDERATQVHAMRVVTSRRRGADGTASAGGVRSVPVVMRPKLRPARHDRYRVNPRIGRSTSRRDRMPQPQRRGATRLRTIRRGRGPARHPRPPPPRASVPCRRGSAAATRRRRRRRGTRAGAGRRDPAATCGAARSRRGVLVTAHVERATEGEAHGTPNRSRNPTRWRLVSSRCPPHTATGMTGTPASAASRTAPVLSARTVNDALTPASGNTPSSSP